jgi:hypothetical protein
MQLENRSKHSTCSVTTRFDASGSRVSVSVLSRAGACPLAQESGANPYIRHATADACGALVWWSLHNLRQSLLYALRYQRLVCSAALQQQGQEKLIENTGALTRRMCHKQTDCRLYIPSARKSYLASRNN